MSEITSIEFINSKLATESLVEKILGTSTTYFQEKTAKWSKGNLGQLSTLFSYAAHKLGEEIDANNSVPTKVIDQVLEHGPLCEEDLQLDYLAGILVGRGELEGRTIKRTSARFPLHLSICAVS